jgi:hypothetical protein
MNRKEQLALSFPVTGLFFDGDDYLVLDHQTFKEHVPVMVWRWLADTFMLSDRLDLSLGRIPAGYGGGLWGSVHQAKSPSRSGSLGERSPVQCGNKGGTPLLRAGTEYVVVRIWGKIVRAPNGHPIREPMKGQRLRLRPVYELCTSAGFSGPIGRSRPFNSLQVTDPTSVNVIVVRIHAGEPNPKSLIMFWFRS